MHTFNPAKLVWDVQGDVAIEESGLLNSEAMPVIKKKQQTCSWTTLPQDLCVMLCYDIVNPLTAMMSFA